MLKQKLYTHQLHSSKMLTMTRIRNKDRELRVSPLVKVVLFVLCVESQSSCSAAVPCYDYFTREARPCFPQPVNAARGRNVTASNTCGKPSTSYCEISPEKKCFICNASSALNMHPAEYMVCNSIFLLEEISIRNIFYFILICTISYLHTKKTEKLSAR